MGFSGFRVLGFKVWSIQVFEKYPSVIMVSFLGAPASDQQLDGVGFPDKRAPSTSLGPRV